MKLNFLVQEEQKNLMMTNISGVIITISLIAELLVA